MVSKKCIVCGIEFSKSQTTSKEEWSRRKFCSRDCHYRFGNHIVTCEKCKKVFTISKSYSGGTVRFCSVVCSNQWKTEHKQTGFFKGHPQYGENNYWLGKKMSEKHKDSISQSLKDNPKNLAHIKALGESHTGKNHWNWKGGITAENRIGRNTDEYKNWRNAVYQRDHYKCQKCGVKCSRTTIVAHHKKEWKDYPELRHTVSNGMTLCRKCHINVHREMNKRK